tara:strand:+ start:100 stop:453 length:354 start_codon:yes stop_codon:yes gene_type:complete
MSASSVKDNKDVSASLSPKASISKYTGFFDDLNSQFSNLNDYFDTQQDIMLLQKDIGRKIHGVNHAKVVNQNNLKNRLLEYNEKENRSSDSMYSFLKFLFIILCIGTIIMLGIKFNK